MKISTIKLFSLLMVLFLVTPAAFSQCTPNPNMGSALIDPPKLPDGVVRQPYSVNFSFRVPRDTFFMSGSQRYDIKIEHTLLEAISGIPYGFSYQCNPSTCDFLGGSVACALLTGNPVDSQVREYPITVVTIVYFTTPPQTTVFQQLQADSNYVFKISYPAGLEIVRKEVFPLKVYPNPTHGQLKIDISSLKNYTLSVVDVLGKTVHSRSATMYATKETIELDMGEFAKGLYTVMLKSEDKTFLSKVTLK